MLKQLTSLGLSENEAKVYVAMLELGPATVLEISAKAGVNRPTTYVQIEALKKMGLISTQTKGKKQLFMAESPEQLEFVIERERKEIEQKKEELIKLLPGLTNLFNLAGEKPQVRFFEGEEGILKIQGEFLKTKADSIYGISDFDSVMELFPNFTSAYSSKRAQRKIPSKLIYTSTKGSFLKGSDEDFMRESKYVSKDKLSLGSDITIFGDKIAIMALKGKISGVIIEHKEMANSLRSVFELLWASI
ncbi:MAG: helix-turn-helix domain-containing protein [bacterium]|nr:helix-turn-helix domain-containing protein [bacterium]